MLQLQNAAAFCWLADRRPYGCRLMKWKTSLLFVSLKQTTFSLCLQRRCCNTFSLHDVSLLVTPEFHLCWRTMKSPMRMCQEHVPQIQRRLGRRGGLILHTVPPKFRVASKFPSLVEISRDKQIFAHLFAEPAGEGQDGFRSFLGPVDQSHVSRLCCGQQLSCDNTCDGSCQQGLR